MRSPGTGAAALLLFLALSGCGYHAVSGSASHLPSGIHTVSVPVFLNETQTPRLEVWMTEAVGRELQNRSGLEVTHSDPGAADAVLRGTIVSEAVTPLLYNSVNSQATTASYVITLQAKVVLTDHAGHVLFENDKYVFRKTYESTQQLSSFIEEDTPARRRLVQEFASAVTGDILESF